MRRLALLATIAISCQTQPRATPVAPLEIEARAPTAPRSPSAEPRFVPFVEPVDLDPEVFENPIRTLTGDFGVVDTAVPGGTRHLLRLSTLEVLDFPPFVGAPTGRPTFHRVTDDLVVALFAEDARASLQLLRLSAMRWEDLGHFDIPDSIVVHRDEKKRNGAWLNTRGGNVVLQLSNEVDVTSMYALDLETLAWAAVGPSPRDLGPCIMSCELEGDDVLRWGLDSTGKSIDCVAARKTPDDAWTRLEDPKKEMIIMRSCKRIDENRVLVTGGITFRFLPFVHRADVVDLQKMEVRHINDEAVGQALNVPGEPYLWIQPGQTTRFDPATETFSVTAGPHLGFKYQWSVQLDERTLLYGGRTDDKTEWRFARMGFRLE